MPSQLFKVSCRDGRVTGKCPSELTGNCGGRVSIFTKIGSSCNGLEGPSKTGTATKPNSLRNHNENFKLHYHYQEYLHLSRGMAHSTIQAALRSLHQFDVFSAHCAYHEITTDQIKWFKDGLEERLEREDISERRSASTIVHTLLNLKDFFLWLESHKGIKFGTQRIGDYFKPSNRLMKLANVVVHKYIPTINDLYEIVA